MKRWTTLVVLGIFSFAGIYFLIGLPGIGLSHHHLGQEYTVSESHRHREGRREKEEAKEGPMHQRMIQKSEERVERLDELLEELKDSEGEEKMEVVEELLTELVEAEKRRSKMMRRGMEMMQEGDMMPEMEEHEHH